MKQAMTGSGGQQFRESRVKQQYDYLKNTSGMMMAKTNNNPTTSGEL